MRKCLKDYCQTVHNPEYLAIDAINSEKYHSNANYQHQFSFNDYINKNMHHSNTLPQPSSSSNQLLQNTEGNGCSNLTQASSFNLSNNRNLKKILLQTNPFSSNNDNSRNNQSKNKDGNSGFLSKLTSNTIESLSSSTNTSSSSPSSSSSVSSSSLSTPSYQGNPNSNLNAVNQLENNLQVTAVTNSSIDNKQTYV